MNTFLKRGTRNGGVVSAATAATLAIAVNAGMITVHQGIATADPSRTVQRGTAGPEKNDVADAKRLEDAQLRALLNAPIPQDVDGLLSHLGKISRLASKTSDDVEQTKLDLAKAGQELARAKKQSASADRKAAEIRKLYDASRSDVTRVSQAKYRGASVDRITAMAGATGPQAALERTTYINALSADTRSKLDSLDRYAREVAGAQSEANRAKATGEFQLRTLGEKKTKLEGRSQQLDALKAKVKDAVDGLSPADRRRWVDRNGPIDVDVNEFLRTKLPSTGDASVTKNAKGVVAAALAKIGSPYGWGSAGPTEFDCSGLMYWAYQQQGKTIPRTSQAQLAGGQSVSPDALQPGDIVAYYPGATHVGMYIGDGKIVHASDYGIPVQVVPVDSMPIVGASRY
ncbi:C40 family peptidase [Corynebacterium auriscanis]|uniref:Hydrolase n=1 Tax=Corynebacterium auriscanis TaxID=99807 RepID=A0A0A2DJ14_9CORY|nr:C40 family peptidase [Corynebacterium auriscanis]KGM19205.1 hydrolase [Corynebacterium auriscanis]WJY72453.1 putative endopeptidase precursor [Corynebacterium auriscanis]